MLRRFVLLSIKLLIIFIIVSCNQKIELAEEGPFIILTSLPGGANVPQEFYPRNIGVFNSGKLVIYTEETEHIKLDDDAPMIEIQLKDEEVEKVKETIQKNRFFSLKEDLSDSGVMDGSFHYITVHTKDETKKVGGEMPINDKFNAIWDEVKSLIDDEYEEWSEEISEYIYEKNPDS